MSVTGEPQGAPMKAGYAVADIYTGLYASVGILSALRRRDATGEGATLDMALLDSEVAVLGFQAEYLAVSFPKNATDMEMARQLANVAGEPWRHKAGLIAKIERSEAIRIWKRF